MSMAIISLIELHFNFMQGVINLFFKLIYAILLENKLMFSICVVFLIAEILNCKMERER